MPKMIDQLLVSFMDAKESGPFGQMPEGSLDALQNTGEVLAITASIKSNIMPVMKECYKNKNLEKMH